METITVKRVQSSGSMDKVKVVDVQYKRSNIDEDGYEWACNQSLITLFSMKEILEKYPNYHFDKYGNLVIVNEHGEKIDHMAPASYKHLGLTFHANDGCVFTDEIWVKKYHGVTKV